MFCSIFFRQFFRHFPLQIWVKIHFEIKDNQSLAVCQLYHVLVILVLIMSKIWWVGEIIHPPQDVTNSNRPPNPRHQFFANPIPPGQLFLQSTPSLMYHIHVNTQYLFSNNFFFTPLEFFLFHRFWQNSLNIFYNGAPNKLLHTHS